MCAVGDPAFGDALSKLQYIRRVYFQCAMQVAKDAETRQAADGSHVVMSAERATESWLKKHVLTMLTPHLETVIQQLQIRFPHVDRNLILALLQGPCDSSGTLTADVLSGRVQLSMSQKIRFDKARENLQSRQAMRKHFTLDDPSEKKQGTKNFKRLAMASLIGSRVAPTRGPAQATSVSSPFVPARAAGPDQAEPAAVDRLAGLKSAHTRQESAEVQDSGLRAALATPQRASTQLLATIQSAQVQARPKKVIPDRLVQSLQALRSGVDHLRSGLNHLDALVQTASEEVAMIDEDEQSELAHHEPSLSWPSSQARGPSVEPGAAPTSVIQNLQSSIEAFVSWRLPEPTATSASCRLEGGGSGDSHLQA